MRKRNKTFTGVRNEQQAQNRKSETNTQTDSGFENQFLNIAVADEPSTTGIVRKMLDHLAANIAYLDREGNILHVNQAFASSNGKTPPDFIGKNAFDLSPNNGLQPLFDRVLQTRQPYSAYNLPDADPQHPENPTTYWDWTLQPLIEPDGLVSGVIFTSVDVTGRHVSEKALEETQALFQLLFESAPDANILTDEAGHILALNRRTETMLGYLRYEMVGKMIEMIIPPRYTQNHIQLRKDYNADPQMRHVGSNEQFFALTRTGQELPVNITLSPLHTENGLLVLCVIRDLSESVQAEKDFRTSEARFHAIFDNAAMGIQLLDAHGNIQMTNQIMQRMLGYSEQDLKGMHFMQFTHEADLPRNLNNFQALLDGKIARYRMEKRYRRKDGSIFWGRLNVSRYDENSSSEQFVIVMVEDINDLRSAEAALRASEANFRTSVETLVDGFAILSPVHDPEGKIIDFRYEYINEAGSRLNKLPREKHIGHTLLELQPALAENGLLDRYIKLVETGEPLMLESLDYEDALSDGQRRRRVFDVNAVPMSSGFAISWRDITARKVAEDALRQQEAMLRTVIDTLPVGVWITDGAGKIQYGNQAGRKIWGGARSANSQELGNFVGWWSLTGDPIRPDDWGVSRAIQKGITTIEEEVVIQTFDKKFKTILNSSAPIYDKDHHIVGAIIVDQDITERKQMQTELGEVQHKLLRNAEEERLHLARELHDGPIQDLYGLTFQLDELEEHVDQETGKETISNARASLQQTIDTLRSIMSELRPPTLAPFGLEKTIQSHAEHFQQLHPEINLHLDLMHDGQTLPETVRLALYRIYQESLNNILRHAHASNITVQFNFDDHSAGLIIRDDGVGFEVPRNWVHLARSGHYGLVGMRERVEALGGRLELTSQPGKGTTYHASVPLNSN